MKKRSLRFGFIGLLVGFFAVSVSLAAVQYSSYKSGSFNLEWNELGPDNVGGSARALLFDSRDPDGKTIYAAGINGGLFKTTNLGSTWNRVVPANGEFGLNISCMVQTPDGSIYMGTGEAFNGINYSGLADYGITIGFVGHGLYKYDVSGNVNLVEGTAPTPNNNASAWSYINEVAASSNDKLWAATNDGLMVQSGGSWVMAKYTEGTEQITLSGKAYDVKVGSNGVVVAAVEGKIYVSANGDPNGFVSCSTGEINALPETGIGRAEIAIAPSNSDVIYVCATTAANNSLFGVYISDDKGLTWELIGPGGSEMLNLLGGYSIIGESYFQGDYDNVITVFPNDPYRILVGGVDLWEGKQIDPVGYYQWSQKSFSPGYIYSEFYLHGNHHAYVFRPGNPNTVAIATDGGISLGTISGDEYAFQPINKGFNVTQFYTVAPSNKDKIILGGAQDNGSLYISGEGNTEMNAYDIWNLMIGFPEATDGGYCAISKINPDVFFYSKSPQPDGDALDARMRRTETRGDDYSNSFVSTDLVSTNFLSPMVLWESFTNENSRDSVKFFADKNYNAGEKVVIKSKNYFRPFDYVLPVSMDEGDSLMVKDIISARMFIGTPGEMFMTKEALDFTKEPEWFLIADGSHSGFEGSPKCLAHSNDANYLFVGTEEGKLFRISNLALAYDYDRADVGSPDCIVATDEMEFFSSNTQVITSVSVDPANANKVLVTLGGYDNTNYVYYTTNALSDNPVFTSVQGNLPAMPVYSSILEMDPANNFAVIGTEQGIWVSDDPATGQWAEQTSNIGKVPVLDLKQQTVWTDDFWMTLTDPGTGQVYTEVWEGIKNYGVIYAATYGRGLFMDNTFETVGITDNPIIKESLSNLTVYPNPVVNHAEILFNISQPCEAALEIYDIRGLLIERIELGKVSAGQQARQIELDNYLQGTYVVRLVAGSNHSSARLIITK